MDVNSREPSQNIIPFRIKGVEIGRFDSSGNLKIGTTTTLAPTVRLDISGGEARVNSGSVTSTALTTTGRIGVNVASPTVSLDVSGAAQITASSVVATALTTKGRIGINTTTPTSDLDVNGTVIMRSTLNLSNSLTLPTVFWHKSSDNVERLQYITSGNTIFKSGNGFLWYDSNNAVRMFLSNSGLLGIGHSSPAYALHIEGGAAYINSNSANNTALVTTGRIGVNTATPTVALDVSGASRMAALSATSTALTTTGRIGINVAAPTVDLDVVGAARLTASSATATALTTTGRIGVNMAAPTVSLDVSGAANVSTYLSVGSGGATTSILPNAFYVRIGNGSNWRDYIPLLVADSTTNIQTWGGPDTQWFSGSVQNEIAQQFSYFAGYWLNANRAVIGTSFSVESFAILSGFATPSTRGIFTFTATAVSNGVVTAYKATLSLGNHGEQQLTPQQDGIDAGVARRSLSNRTLIMGGNVETGYLGVLGVARVSASSATATALTTTGRIGVNTATPTVDLEVNGLAKLGNVNIVPLYVFTSHTFTNAGATGRLGPTLTTVRNHSDYASVNWAQNNSYLSMTSDNGIQLWTVPISGNYTIRAKGAAGLDTRGGKGRDIQLTTTLIKGEVIRILVGQQGTGASGDNYSSGGGGTFVVRGTDTPIIIAGGGGGRGDVIEPFSHANIATTGQITPNGYYGGGTGHMPLGGGGDSGFHGAGGGFNINNTNQPRGGVSFTAGGAGGQGDYNINGGFGGGGGWLNQLGGAGGGGYSGGGSGGSFNGILGGGGGGSFGITTLTDFGAINTGHGSVLITLTTPSVALEVVGVAVVTGSSATATALTTTGRIGVNTAAPAVDLDVNGIMRSNTGLKLGNAATTAMTGSNSTLDVENTDRARARFTSGTNIFTIGTHSNTSTPSESFIYNETSTPMTFGTNGNERMRITADGKVGIGTSTPQFPLDIVGTTTANTYYDSYWWGKESAGNTINPGHNYSSSTSNPISMRLNGSVLIASSNGVAGFWATSDRRIKKNINYNISSECLNLFRQLKCSNYRYIDERANKTNVYGYIAQDVSTVIPYAVTTQKGFIPSLYSLAKISKENGIVKITCYEQKTYTFHSLHDNQGKAFINDNNEPASDNDGGRHFKVKLFDVSMNEYIVRINEILDNGVFTIENDDVSIKLTNEEYFVFGQEIDDYKILNNEAIAIVATAALQEVDRQQQADKARIAELEATVATQQSLINDILERLNKNGL